MRWIILSLLCLGLSCSDKNPVSHDDTAGEGTAVIEAAVATQDATKANAVETTTKAKVFIYASDNSLLVNGRELSMQGKRATGSIKVKAGSGYTVRLKGYDSSGAVTYYGSTSNITIKKGKTTTVQITLTKAIDITMVSISAGSFQMGDISGDGESYERPFHTVTLSSFEMSIYEIAQGQYTAVIGSNPSYFTGDDNYPVEYVSWYDAMRFCNRLSDAAGLDRCYNESTWACDFSMNGFRLPTEAEWEYACRAGTTTEYYTGDSESDLARAGWYYGNSSSKTHPVGQKVANTFGLYDMHGNVWEWCNDWYGSYGSGSVTDPTGAHTGSYRVIRGGSWSLDGGYCRSARRDGRPPAFRDYYVGFRVLRRASP